MPVIPKCHAMLEMLVLTIHAILGRNSKDNASVCDEHG